MWDEATAFMPLKTAFRNVLFETWNMIKCSSWCARPWHGWCSYFVRSHSLLRWSPILLHLKTILWEQSYQDLYLIQESQVRLTASAFWYWTFDSFWTEKVEGKNCSNMNPCCRPMGIYQFDKQNRYCIQLLHGECSARKSLWIIMRAR